MNFIVPSVAGWSNSGTFVSSYIMHCYRQPPPRFPSHFKSSLTRRSESVGRSIDCMLRPGAFIATAARARVQRPADTIQWLVSEWHLGQFTWQAAAGLNSGDSPYNEHTLECVLQSTSKVQRPKWKEAHALVRVQGQF